MNKFQRKKRLPEGGTVTKELPPEKQELQALPDEQICELAKLGQKIEAHYGQEQDIEWAFADGRLYILQSRPITSLYPVPSISDDKLHVLINLGYIQMMTDSMKPLGLSVLSRIPDFLKKNPTDPSITREAGGRAFIDITGALAIKPIQKRVLKVLHGMDQLMASAVSEAVKREEFKHQTMRKQNTFGIAKTLAPIFIPAALKVAGNLYFKDPGKAEKQAGSFIERTVRETAEKLKETSGAETIRLIQQDMGNMLPHVVFKVAVYFLTGVVSSGYLEKKLKNKVGDEQSALLLSKLYKSLPHNVTTDMGLALGDLSDQARRNPEVIRYLQQADSTDFAEGLTKIPGGAAFIQELDHFLGRYGMRCAGEIDITKPRWSEDPAQLAPSILSNIQTAGAEDHRKKYKQGEREAKQAEREIVSQFSFPQKRNISRLVRVYRSLMGMREHHKFTLVQLMFLYKKAILKEARSLVQKGILEDEADVFYFTLEELIALLESREIGCIPDILETRKRQHELNQKLKSPRVMTSKGEVITGKLHNAKSPEGALLGTPVSAGVIEGKARVITRLEDAKLNPGDILVAPYTDPGWTPLFTSAVGLITEVGGMMTHGSVVAREYGIPGSCRN
ncbi:PEP/pyruvate-binding domain-containing protein [Bacillus swezeyi]